MPLVMLSVTVGMSLGACAILTLGSDCVANIVYAVEMLADEWAVAVTDGTIETRFDVNIGILAFAVTSFKVALPPPFEDTALSRFAPFSC